MAFINNGFVTFLIKDALHLIACFSPLDSFFAAVHICNWGSSTEDRWSVVCLEYSKAHPSQNAECRMAGGGKVNKSIRIR